MSRFHPIPLYFSVPATSINGQISKALVNSTRIAEIYMIFPAGTNLNLLYRFFMLGQLPPSLTTLPGSGDLTINEIPAGNFTGDAISYSIPFQYPIDQSAPYLGMFASNNTANALSAQAIAIIEEP